MKNYRQNKHLYQFDIIGSSISKDYTIITLKF